MSGSFTGPLACDGAVLTPGVSGRDIFLVTFNALGADAWCRAFSPDNSASTTDLATDTAGNVYLSGDFIGSLDLGGGSLANAGNTDAFIASFTPTGTHRWSLSIGGAVADHMVDIVIDADVVLWLAGYFALTLDFGSSHLVSNGSLQDVAVLAMDLSGAPIRGWSFGGSAYDFAYGIALSGTSCLQVTGRTDADVDFGGGVLPAKGGADAFLLELCW
jgi:hypothetical protein